jgi:hypothetical protein
MTGQGSCTNLTMSTLTMNVCTESSNCNRIRSCWNPSAMSDSGMTMMNQNRAIVMCPNNTQTFACFVIFNF